MSHTVLVVEDDIDIRQALVEILEDQGFETLGARDGAGRARHPLPRQPTFPCVILLDLMMPVMDGAAFREAQRNDPRIASIPVVVLSAYRDVERHAAPLDAVSVLRKPPTVRELVTVLRAHC
jgi:two-component system response regulator MprA